MMDRETGYVSGAGDFDEPERDDEWWDEPAVSATDFATGCARNEFRFPQDDAQRVARSILLREILVVVPTTTTVSSRRVSAAVVVGEAGEDGGLERRGTITLSAIDAVSLEEGPKCWECGALAEHRCAMCERGICGDHTVSLRFGSDARDHLEMFVCVECAA